jgi:DNA-binding NarL/FixJ family response regulator
MATVLGHSPPWADFHATASSEKAQCLIVDIQLNGAGIELGRQLSLTHPTLPVIFTTGSDTEDNRSAVQQVGAAGYLPKPFGSKSLLEAIQTAVGPRS